MTAAFSYHVSTKGHLLLAIEALKFAKEQRAVGKIALALASARRDLARLKGKRKSAHRAANLPTAANIQLCGALGSSRLSSAYGC
jgi:hypothetical protein